MIIYALMGSKFPWASPDYLNDMDYRLFVSYFTAIGDLNNPPKKKKNLLDNYEVKNG